MSKFTEYINLTLKGIPHYKEIVSGIINDVQFSYGKMTEEQRQEIVKRRVICAGCPFMSQHAKTSEEYKALKGKHYVTRRKEDHCSLCGCMIKAKTASLQSNCGIESHNQEEPENLLPLKWTKLEQDGK